MARRLGYAPNPAGKALAARKHRPVVGVAIPSEGNLFFDEVIRGMKEAAEQYHVYGLQVRYYTMKGYQAAHQLQQLAAMEDDIQALVISPVNEPSIREKLTEMSERGIFVVTVNNDIRGIKHHCYVGTDYFNGGITACALLAAIKGKTADIGILLGSEHILGHHLRLAGFRKRMERQPGFRIADIIEHEDDDFAAYDLTRKMLELHPEIDAIASLAAGFYGTCRAILQLPADRRPLVIGFDSVPTTVEMMKWGIVKAIIYQHPYHQGHVAIDLAFDYLVRGIVPAQNSYIVKHEIKLLENL
jgi:LacI family transcriptional regulator